MLDPHFFLYQRRKQQVPKFHGAPWALQLHVISIYIRKVETGFQAVLIPERACTERSNSSAPSPLSRFVPSDDQGDGTGRNISTTDPLICACRRNILIHKSPFCLEINAFTRALYPSAALRLSVPVMVTGRRLSRFRIEGTYLVGNLCLHLFYTYRRHHIQFPK